MPRRSTPSPPPSTRPGFLVCCVDDAGAAALAARQRAAGLRVVTVSTRPGVADVGPEALAGFTLWAPGDHYLADALLALAAGRTLGYADAELASGIASFTGTRRRMERKGEAGGVRVYDSYAHHPTEITGDLASARELAGARPAARGVPAAPGLAHPDVRNRDGRGAGGGRRGRRLRRLPRPRGPRPLGDGCAGGVRRTSSSRARRLRPRPRRRPGRPGLPSATRRPGADPGGRQCHRASARASSSCSAVIVRSLRRSSGGDATADGTIGPTIDKATRRSRRRFARRQWRRRWLAWRYLLVLVLVLAIVGGGIYAVWFSTWLAVEDIEVSGAQTVEPADIRARSGIDEGEPLVRVDLATAERRIGALAVVRSVSVTRQWPHGVLISIEERVADRGGRDRRPAARHGRRRRRLPRLQEGTARAASRRRPRSGPPRPPSGRPRR